MPQAESQCFDWGNEFSNQMKKELKSVPLPDISEDGLVTPLVSFEVTDRLTENVKILKHNSQTAIYGTDGYET